MYEAGGVGSVNRLTDPGSPIISCSMFVYPSCVHGFSSGPRGAIGSIMTSPMTGTIQRLVKVYVCKGVFSPSAAPSRMGHISQCAEL